METGDGSASARISRQTRGMYEILVLRHQGMLESRHGQVVRLEGCANRHRAAGGRALVSPKTQPKRGRLRGNPAGIPGVPAPQTKGGQMKAIGFLIVFTFIELLFYGVGAFIAWDWNPGNWLTEARFMIGICGTFTAALFASQALT